jgi:hypothetical protein
MTIYTVFADEEELNIESLAKMNDIWQKDFVTRFTGIEVRLDESLADNQYYIAVSPKLHEQIQKGKKDVRSDR